MKELLSAVHALTEEEYARAAAKFGAAHNSTHEAYAVILEEFEEASEEMEFFSCQLESFWRSVKINCVSSHDLLVMQETAERAAAEMIQVAAMCRKAMEWEKEGP